MEDEKLRRWRNRSLRIYNGECKSRSCGSALECGEELVHADGGVAENAAERAEGKFRVGR
jgi:hypothetical protein